MEHWLTDNDGWCVRSVRRKRQTGDDQHLSFQFSSLLQVTAWSTRMSPTAIQRRRSSLGMNWTHWMFHSTFFLCKSIDWTVRLSRWQDWKIVKCGTSIVTDDGKNRRSIVQWHHPCLNTSPQDIRRNLCCSPLIRSRSSMSLSISFFILSTGKVPDWTFDSIQGENNVDTCPIFVMPSNGYETLIDPWDEQQRHSARRWYVDVFLVSVQTSLLTFCSREELRRNCRSEEQRQEEWHVVCVVRDPWRSWIDLDDESDDEQSDDLVDQSDTRASDWNEDAAVK